MSKHRRRSYRFIPVFNHIFDPREKYFLLKVVGGAFTIAILLSAGNYLLNYMDLRWAPDLEILNYTSTFLFGLMVLIGLIQGSEDVMDFVVIGTFCALIGLVIWALDYGRAWRGERSSGHEWVNLKGEDVYVVFEPDYSSSDLIANICTQVPGFPLLLKVRIERTLSPEEIFVQNDTLFILGTYQRLTVAADQLVP